MMSTLSEQDDECSPSPAKKKKRPQYELDSVSDGDDEGNMFKLQAVDDFMYHSPNKNLCFEDQESRSIKSEDDSPLKMSPDKKKMISQKYLKEQDLKEREKKMREESDVIDK